MYTDSYIWVIEQKNGVTIICYVKRLKQIISKEINGFKNVISQSELNLGCSFYFEINGLPIFVKGANWVPSTLTPSRPNGLMYNGTTNGSHWSANQLLRSAHLAGINLIRIWGGGRYESDEFYLQADRLGLMIWHDMMFAVATYTGQNSMSFDNVETEIKRQIGRLHSHPSIIIWSTDNEVKQAIADGWYAQPYDPELLENFKSRFVDSIYEIIKKEEIDGILEFASGYIPRNCLISSPSNGIITQKQRGLDKNPMNKMYGDVHYYRYNGEIWSESNYILGRFISEFGIQSFPSPLAWSRSINPHTSRIRVENNHLDDRTNWLIDGPLMSHRQHHSLGHKMLEAAIDMIGIPVDRASPSRNYSRWAYISQLSQAMCYRAQINLAMRHQCRLEDSNPSKIINRKQRLSMGTIYWQLNDIWSAPTWSSLDAAGQWKMVHYATVREYFQTPPWGRIAIHLNLANQIIADWIPNVQTWTSILVPDQFKLMCFTIRSFEPTYQTVLDLNRTGLDLTCPVTILNISLESLIGICQFGHQPPAQLMVHIRLVWNHTDYDSDGNLLQLDKPKHVSPQNWSTQNRIWIEHIGQVPAEAIVQLAPFETDIVYELVVRARLPELFVWLQIDPKLDSQYWFDTNAFHLVTQRKRHIRLYLANLGTHLTIGQLEQYIWIDSLSTLGRNENEDDY